MKFKTNYEEDSPALDKCILSPKGEEFVLEQVKEWVDKTTNTCIRTLRDEFAMAALQAIPIHPDDIYSDIAEVIYRLADAMMEARKAEYE